MVGYAVLEKLRESPSGRDIPVIFVTAMESSEDEERGLLLGAVDYITKPITPAIVLARVRTQLEAKQARDMLKKFNLQLTHQVEEGAHALEQAQLQLMQSEKMASIGQLAAGVAHEINNPVGFVSSNLGRERGRRVEPPDIGMAQDLALVVPRERQAEAVVAALHGAHAVGQLRDAPCEHLDGKPQHHERGRADADRDRRRAGMSVQGRISGELLLPCETPGRRASSYSRRREVNWSGRHLSAQPSSNCYPLVVTLSACII